MEAELQLAAAYRVTHPPCSKLLGKPAQIRIAQQTIRLRARHADHGNMTQWPVTPLPVNRESQFIKHRTQTLGKRQGVRFNARERAATACALPTLWITITSACSRKV